MINLKEIFGQKYRVDFDRKSYSADRKVDRYGTGKVSTDKQWYYSIPCKLGYIAISSDKDDLSFYCKSARVAKIIEKEMGRQTVDCWISDSDAMIYFKIEHITEIFKYAKPRRKRQLTEEQRLNLVSRMEKCRRKKQEITPKNPLN